MRLEDEVSVPLRFESERQKTILNLVYTYGVLLEQTLKILQPFDLNDQHFNILKTLNEHDPKAITVGEIKQALLNKRGDLTRLLDKLSAMGLIVRESAPTDRRIVLVRLSAQGREHVREIDSLLFAQRDSRLGLSEEEAELLNTLLDKFRG